MSNNCKRRNGKESDGKHHRCYFFHIYHVLLNIVSLEKCSDYLKAKCFFFSRIHLLYFYIGTLNLTLKKYVRICKTVSQPILCKDYMYNLNLFFKKASFLDI